MMPRLPDAATEPEATILIRPSRGWASLSLGELWAYRELLYFLTWRDVKVRYKQTVFGAVWAILQPLMLMVVFSLFLGRIEGISPAGIPYPLFAFAGLVPWTLFSQSLVRASDSLVGASNLIQKVYFPRLLLPIAAIGPFLLDFAVAMVLLLALLVFFGSPPTLAVLWVLPLAALAVMTSLSVGVFLSAVNVQYRDVRHAVPFLVQVWLFASPVAYSVDLVPDEWRTLFNLNPMAGVLDGFRWAALSSGTPPPLGAIATSAAVTAFIFVAGVAYFRRVERSFADVI